MLNRGTSTATGVVLDAQVDPALRLVSTALDCSGGMPCALGEIAPGALKTVIAVFSFTGGAPRQASVQFRITGGSPAPADRDAVDHRAGHPRLGLQQRRERTRRWAGSARGGRLDGPSPTLASD